MIAFEDVPSPNFGPRAGPGIDMLILHYTGMQSGAAALARLCDPVANVSAHWLIEADGRVFRLVDERQRARHAGVSHWAGETDINSRSVGIELVNPGHEWGYASFPPSQMTALAQLAGEIVARHRIPARRVLGHSDVAPRRKQDPGEKLDWAWLAARGVGLWPASRPAAASIDLAAAWLALERIGYDPDPAARVAVVTAFQRHWCPARMDGALDPLTLRRIGEVAHAFASER